MFLHAFRVLTERVTYEPTASGWRGEFRGPFTLTADAPTIEACRRSLIDEMDARLAEWLAQVPPSLGRA